jgi:hypothetical protein
MHVGIVVKKVMTLASVPSPRIKHGLPRVRKHLRRVSADVLLVVGLQAERTKMKR